MGLSQAEAEGCLTPAPYSVEMHMDGACVVADRPNLCPGCRSDGEVDVQIRRLKQLLDRVAVKMKRAIKEDEDKPVFDD